MKSSQKFAKFSRKTYDSTDRQPAKGGRLTTVQKPPQGASGAIPDCLRWLAALAGCAGWLHFGRKTTEMPARLGRKFMGIYGNLWEFMGIYGNLWEFMGISAAEPAEKLPKFRIGWTRRAATKTTNIPDLLVGWLVGWLLLLPASGPEAP